MHHASSEFYKADWSDFENGKTIFVWVESENSMSEETGSSIFIDGRIFVMRRLVSVDRPKSRITISLPNGELKRLWFEPDKILVSRK